MKKLLSGLAVFALAAVSLAADEPYVPDELKPWRQWVLHGEEFRNCPMFFNRQAGKESFVCSWAEPLQLMVNARGGRFDMRVRTYTRTWVALPGDEQNLPQEVSVNNRPAAVVRHEGHPAISLAPGVFRINGRFSWVSRPETLRLPVSLALLQLNVDGRVITNPERQGDRLWLGEPRRTAAQPESLEIKVYRKVIDRIPIELETRLRLAVSGSAREALLGRALPDGFVPTALASALPARIEPDGRLRLQLRPGNWELRLSGRKSTPGDRIALDDPGEPWAATEVWSFQSVPSLRITNVTGETPVDPGQVDVPAEWRQLPAFRLMSGQALTIDERGRGISDEEANRLSLSRTLWLDFDGRALTARDSISGQMRRGWRLDMRAPFELTSASSRGENLLVTAGAETGLSGVEVRTPALDIVATSRVPMGGELPVSGWDEQVAELDATLRLPPGFRFIAAPGADHSPGAWVNRWQLLDYFLVLLIAFGVRRLFGNVAGIVALLALAVSFHEPGAPVWSWLNLIVALALAGAVREGRFAPVTRWYRNLSYLLVLVLLVPFVANQARLAMFPQLETEALLPMTQYGVESHRPTTQPVADMAREVAALEQAGISRKARPASPVPEPAQTSEAADMIVVTGVKSVSMPETQHDPNALVQTGPGLPDWNWRSERLAWGSPVSPDQTYRLVLLGPWQTALWRVVAALLATALFVLLLRSGFNVSNEWRRLRGAGATAALACLAVLFAVPGESVAETPPQQVLNELKKRLTAAPECAPECALVPSARVDASRDGLAIELEIHALEMIAVPLPGGEDSWLPDAFSVDGRVATLLYRDDAGVLWLPLDEGIHRLRLEGRMPGQDEFQVAFPMRPGEVLASAAGWELSGVRDQRLVAGAIGFTRVKPVSPGAAVATEATTADRFPTFVRVTRTLQLGLDWRVASQVNRVAPERGAINVEIPLLAGESVTSEHARVIDGRVAVALAPDAFGYGWAGALPPSGKISLTAPADQPWVEVWRLAAGHIWHVEHAGTPLIRPEQILPDSWIPEFYPRPGESLEIAVRRPEAVPGATLALDRAAYVQDVGERNSELSLVIDYRSTRGGQHAIMLPENADLDTVVIDGREQSLRLDRGRLMLPILPGSHNVRVGFRIAEGATWAQRQPGIDLGAATANVTLGMNLPRDRWVLAARGPTLGPAVLYWAEIVVFILLAWLLGKTRVTPLKTRDWLLLGLGFSTFSWGVLALVTAWLFVMGWRERSPDWSDSIWFNLRQLFLAVVSVGVLLTLLSAIPMALLGNPDMHIAGNGSSMYQLRWFTDQSAGSLPEARIFSTPLWAYKALILLWSLWLSFSLVRWLPWAWNAFRRGGFWIPPDRGRGESADQQ